LVEFKQALSGLRRNVVPLIDQDRGQPGGLAAALLVLDVHLAPTRIEDDEPDEPRPHDEPDDQQPPVEFGVHRREV